MRRSRLWLGVTLLVGLLSGCGGAPAATVPSTPAVSTSAPAAPTTASASAPTQAAAPTAGAGAFTATDATSTTITLPAAATRIACTATPCVDIAYSLGLEPVAVMSSDITDLPGFFGARANSFGTVGGSFDAPNLEDLVAAKPDLVIGFAGDQPSLRQGLGSLPVFYVNARTGADAFRELRSVGALTGRAEQAEAAIARFEQRLKSYQANITTRRTAAAISGGDVNFELLTDQSLQGSLLAQVADYPFALPPGAQNSGGFVPYSLEELLRKDPEVLLTITPTWAGDAKPLSEQLAATPLWKELRAVKEGRMHEAPGAWGNYGGVRGMELLLDEAVPLIYPETFPQPLPAADDAAPATSDLSFTDSTSTTVTLPQQVTRVACVTDICVDMLYELGLEPTATTAGLPELPQYYGEKGKAFSAIGGTFDAPSLEDIAAAKPDLVIGLKGVHDGMREGLKTIAPLMVVDPRTYTDSLAYLRLLGKLTGRTAQAEAAATRFEAKLAAYKAKSPNNRTVLLLGGSDVNVAVETQGTIYGNFLAELTPYPWPSPGPGSGEGAGFVPYSVEQIIKVDPDVIFVESFVFDPNAKPISEQLKANPLWNELKAVKTGNVYEVQNNIWAFSRGTRAFGLVLDELMTTVYPETFPQPLP